MRPLFLACLLFSAVASLAQTPRPVPKVIDHLMTRRGSANPVTITALLRGFIPSGSIPRKLEKEWQHLVCTSEGLFAKINGTGVLFQLSRRGDGIVFTRVDSSYFWGADFGALLFSRKDSIYSLGGYGFWRNSGHLRSFDTLSHGWSVRQLDREVQVDASLSGTWVQPDAGAVYVAGTRPLDDGVIGMADREHTADSSLWRLDLRTGHWMVMGLMTERLKPGFDAPWGLMSDRGVKAMDFRLYDIGRNSILKPGPELQARLEAAWSRVRPEINYFIDSTLYIGDPVADTFDSLPMRYADFMATGSPVFKPQEPPMAASLSRPILLLSGLFAGVFGMIVFQFLTSMNKRNTPSSKPAEDPAGEIRPPSPAPLSSDPPVPSRDLSTVFTPMELELIQLVRARTLAGATATIDDVNRVLGLSAKNESVQKKNRSDVITSINQKWMLMKQTDMALIQRKRSEFDGRFFEYHMGVDGNEGMG